MRLVLAGGLVLPVGRVPADVNMQRIGLAFLGAGQRRSHRTVRSFVQNGDVTLRVTGMATSTASAQFPVIELVVLSGVGPHDLGAGNNRIAAVVNHGHHTVELDSNFLVLVPVGAKEGGMRYGV